MCAHHVTGNAEEQGRDMDLSETEQKRYTRQMKYGFDFLRA